MGPGEQPPGGAQGKGVRQETRTGIWKAQRLREKRIRSLECGFGAKCYKETESKEGGGRIRHSEAFLVASEQLSR